MSLSSSEAWAPIYFEDLFSPLGTVIDLNVRFRPVGCRAVGVFCCVAWYIVDDIGAVLASAFWVAVAGRDLVLFCLES